MPEIDNTILTHEEQLSRRERLKGKGFEAHESNFDEEPFIKVMPKKKVKKSKVKK